MNRKTPIGVVVSLLFLTGAALALTLNKTPRPQSSKRVWNIKIQQSGKEPLLITRLRLGSRQIQSGADFEAADEDLAKLKVEVYNSSNQPITYAELHLDLITKEGPENEVHRIEIKYESAIQPGATVEIGWATADADIKALNEMHGGHHLPTAGDLEVGMVVFANKTTAWMMGRYLFLGKDGKWKIDGSRIEQKPASKVTSIIGQCYDLPRSGDPVSQRACSLCSDCAFMEPVIVRSDAGYARKTFCRKCFHLVGGFIDQNSPCSLATGQACDQTNVFTLDFSKGC